MTTYEIINSEKSENYKNMLKTIPIYHVNSIKTDLIQCKFTDYNEKELYEFLIAYFKAIENPTTKYLLLNIIYDISKEFKDEILYDEFKQFFINYPKKYISVKNIPQLMNIVEQNQDKYNVLLDNFVKNIMKMCYITRSSVTKTEYSLVIKFDSTFLVNFEVKMEKLPESVKEFIDHLIKSFKSIDTHSKYYITRNKDMYHEILDYFVKNIMKMCYITRDSSPTYYLVIKFDSICLIHFDTIIRKLPETVFEFIDHVKQSFEKLNMDRNYITRHM